MIIALAASFVLGALLERFVMRRFEESEPDTQVVVTIGLFTFLAESSAPSGASTTSPTPSSSRAAESFRSPASPSASGRSTTFLAILMLMVLLQLLFRGTKLGLGLRAVADNSDRPLCRESRSGNMLMIGWGLAAALGTAAGVLLAAKLQLYPGITRLHPRLRPRRVILGGLDSPVGAVVAAWVIAIARASRGVRAVHRARLQGDRSLPLPVPRAGVRPQGPVRSHTGGSRLMATTTPSAAMAAKPWVSWTGAAARRRADRAAPRRRSVHNQTIARILVFAVAVLGLNIVMGYAGQVSLGQVFFVGLGAYAAAITDRTGRSRRARPASRRPRRRLRARRRHPRRRGARHRARRGAAARPRPGPRDDRPADHGGSAAKRFSDLTGGSEGMSARFTRGADTSPTRTRSSTPDPRSSRRSCSLSPLFLVRGKFGRAFAIVKENEAIASSMGISPYRYKVLAFTIAAIYGGVSGFLYVVAIQFISPDIMGFGPLDRARDRHDRRRRREHRRLAARRDLLRPHPADNERCRTGHHDSRPGCDHPARAVPASGRSRQSSPRHPPSRAASRRAARRPR